MLRGVADVAGLVAVRLELLGSLQVWDGLAAATQLVQRVAEVVVRVALVRVGRPGALQLLDGLLEVRQRARVVAFTVYS